jgi:Flp pilus assembly protein TadG
VLRQNRQKGFILIAMSVSMFLLLAVVGMSFDLGRVYITRNEAQIFVDAASMSAAKQLDGTAAGLDRARAAVAALPDRWNLGTENFSGVVIEFSADGKQWDADPKDLKALHFARVTAPDNHVTIMFLRAVGGPPRFTVPARAVASTNPVRLTE